MMPSLINFLSYLPTLLHFSSVPLNKKLIWCGLNIIFISHSRRTSGTWWWTEFRQWDHTANQRRWYYARDFEHSRGGGSRGSHSRGRRSQGFGWSQGSFFTAGDERFGVLGQPEEGRRWFKQATYDQQLLIVIYDQMILSMILLLQHMFVSWHIK